MGKYPPSKLRAAFSEWHYKKLNPMSFGMDIDFIETKKENGLFKPIGFIEVTRPGHKLTDQEIHIYLWLMKTTKLPVYVVSTSESFDTFEVWVWPTFERMHFSEEEFIRWENGLRGYKSTINMDNIDWDSINRQLCAPKIPKGVQKSLDFS